MAKLFHQYAVLGCLPAIFYHHCNHWGFQTEQLIDIDSKCKLPSEWLLAVRGRHNYFFVDEQNLLY